MKNTNYFGLTATGALVNLGVCVESKNAANLLADNAESVAAANGSPIEIVAILDISDLYRLRTEMADALNNLDNAALGGEPVTFDLTPEELAEA